MFIGHLALGFAAKRAAPTTSLATLLAASQMADLVWPVLVAMGVEQVRIAPGNTAVTPLDFVSYPYSHSLIGLAVWGALFGLLFRRGRPGARVASLLAALVVSHWVLDFVTHRPDMPLYPGGARYGLGLWNSVPGTVLVEGTMYLAGVWLYLRSTRPIDAIGKWALWSLVVFLVAAYAGNIMGPPPPSIPALYTFAIVSAAVLMAWSWWADHHRVGETEAALSK